MKNPAQKTFYASEKAEQAAVVQYLRMKGIPFIAHMTGVNLHGNFALINALKRSGCLQDGISDLQILKPSGGYHAAFIEMKREKGGVLSPSQREWLEARKRDGYFVAVCRGADEAISVINLYYEGKLCPSIKMALRAL